MNGLVSLKCQYSIRFSPSQTLNRKKQQHERGISYMEATE